LWRSTYETIRPNLMAAGEICPGMRSMRRRGGSSGPGPTSIAIGAQPRDEQVSDIQTFVRVLSMLAAKRWADSAPAVWRRRCTANASRRSGARPARDL
jgi:hypothetical protein